MSTISVIIPVLNEADCIVSTLERVKYGEDIEIMVVDGGSTDSTLELLDTEDTEGVQVISTYPGRGHQMNQGVRKTTGDYLLFLHGDTQLPFGYDRWVRQILRQPRVVAGAFELAIEGDNWQYRVVEWGVKWRSHLFGLPYGDQGFFLSRAVFNAIGGFEELPILEDWILIQKLNHEGKIAIAPLPLLTSPRRWQKLGVCRTTLINQQVLLAYKLGVDLHHIARWYRQQR